MVRYDLMNFKELGQFHQAQNTNIGMRLNNKVPLKKQQQQNLLVLYYKIYFSLVLYNHVAE